MLQKTFKYYKLKLVNYLNITALFGIDSDFAVTFLIESSTRRYRDN